MTIRVGCYPGSFDPPTVAHLAVADAARRHHRLDRVDLMVSRSPLGKDTAARPSLEVRIEILGRLTARLGWLGLVVSEQRLIVDLARGYDVVIMGADKWVQVNDPSFYGHSRRARDVAVADLPTVAVVPRGPHPVPPELALPVDPAMAEVSSTLAREGRVDLMVPEAAAHEAATGDWASRRSGS